MINRKFTLLAILCCLLTFSNCKQEKPVPAENKQAEVEKLQPEEIVALNATLENMQGKWKSADDQTITLEVKGDKFTTYKSGKVLSEEKFVFHNRCPKTCYKENQSGNNFCFTLSDGATTNCYLVRELSKDVSIKYAAIDNSTVLSFVRN